MASVCPFCNSVLPPLAAPPAGDKLPCPRCGEPIPAARWNVDEQQHLLRAGEPTPIATWKAEAGTAPMTVQHPSGLGIRKTLLILFGIMFSMAAIGLSYALWTKNLRRSRDPHKQEILQPVALRRPLQLSGMSYLPQGCQIVVGFQVAEIGADKAGKELLKEPRPATIDWLLKQIRRTTGLNLEELDHVLAATSLDLQSPQLVLVVKTRLKYSLEKIAEALPTKATLHQGQPLYEFSLKPMGEAMLWCVEDRTLLYVIRLDAPKLEHLQVLSAKERPVRELLPAPLYETLEKRLSRPQLLWAAGTLDRLGMLKDFLPLFLGAKMDLGPLLDVKRFGVGVESVDGLTLTGHFQLADAMKASRLKVFLEGVQIGGTWSAKVEAPPPDEPEPWLTWQVRGDVAGMRALLNRDLEPKK